MIESQFSQAAHSNQKNLVYYETDNNSQPVVELKGHLLLLNFIEYRFYEMELYNYLKDSWMSLSI